MALTILLEDELGGAIRTLSQDLKWEELGFQERCRFRLLKYIDSYGDTTFNTLQLAALPKVGSDPAPYCFLQTTS